MLRSQIKQSDGDEEKKDIYISTDEEQEIEGSKGKPPPSKQLVVLSAAVARTALQAGNESPRRAAASCLVTLKRRFGALHASRHRPLHLPLARHKEACAR